MMKDYDESVKTSHKLDWLYISDNLYRVLIIGGSGSGKTNMLLSLIKHPEPDFDRTYLYVKDPSEPKYKLLINGRKKLRIKKLKNQKAFIGYL